MFPLIVAAGVLEHVQKPVDFVKKIARHLLPGGTLLATVPNAASLHRRLGVDMGMLGELHELSAQDHKVGHCRYYDFASFRGDIESGGLKVSKMEGLVLKPFPNSKMDELTEPFCDALFNVGRTLPEWGAEIFVRAEKGEQK
ncbi:MAG TPA: methyltransferase domain-containing protein [Bdellovibrionales bacterium]|nr:methyltransferase domain-containing protein [Bdellovibrionales bacterium]